MIFALYLIAFLSLFNSFFVLFTLVEKFPLKYIYYHFLYRKKISWFFFTGSILITVLFSLHQKSFSLNTVPPLILVFLALILSYKMHQENRFKAVDFPVMTKDYQSLPIEENRQLALIETEGITKAYPLDYVIHHHVLNDRFANKIISLTYCAMCRSVIPFDVTDIGPLFVASFKNANLVLADRKTKTFFQQESCRSLIGKLHPANLKVLPFQVLSWKEVKSLGQGIEVAVVNKKDFHAFNLPVPGLWKKVMSSELTPGLSSKDTTFPSKTHIIALKDSSLKEKIAYLKSELESKTIIHNKDLGVFIINTGSSIIAFRDKINKNIIILQLNDKKFIVDEKKQNKWDLRGNFLEGEIKKNLQRISISEEYWFAWRKFHPEGILIRI